MTYPSMKVSFVLEDRKLAFERCGKAENELLTLARCWYTLSRSMGYKPPILPVPLARHTSHRT